MSSPGLYNPNSTHSMTPSPSPPAPEAENDTTFGRTLQDDERTVRSEEGVVAKTGDGEKGDPFLVKFEEGDKENPMVCTYSVSLVHRLRVSHSVLSGYVCFTFRLGLLGTDGI